MKEDAIGQIEQIIDYKFTDRELLQKAFTHSSAADSRSLSNERLEFLGDSVLAVVLCRELYERFPDYLEGDLTKLKSMLVSRRTCAQVMKRLGLIRYLQVGKGVSDSRALSGSISAALLEAIIAVIYIDGGFESAGNFILRTFAWALDKCSNHHPYGNFKSLLQQYAQQHFNITPVYEMLDEKGPDHDKCFEVGAIIGEHHYRSAWGTNKKEAEQKAALNALIELGIIKSRRSEDYAEADKEKLHH